MRILVFDNYQVYLFLDDEFLSSISLLQIIAQHQNLLISQHPNVNYALLSNDNGFLNFNPNFFTQRTLVARFQMNLTHPPSIQTIKKPVLSVMGLLALLGDTQVDVLSGTLAHSFIRFFYFESDVKL